MLNQILYKQTICISVTPINRIVLAKTLFDTSVNYRSVVLFGKAVLVEKDNHRMKGMKIITENIVKGRWGEVADGTESQLKATKVNKFSIEKASAKIGSGSPIGDENIMDEAWCGEITLTLKVLPQMHDKKFGIEMNMSDSVKNYFEKNKLDKFKHPFIARIG